MMHATNEFCRGLEPRTNWLCVVVKARTAAADHQMDDRFREYDKIVLSSNVQWLGMLEELNIDLKIVQITSSLYFLSR